MDMDRFVVREPRIGTDFPQANQILGTGLNIPRNHNMIPPETMCLGGYGRDPIPHHMGSTGLFNAHQQNMMSANYTPQMMNTHANAMPGHSQLMSGIDPRYLSSYSDGSAQFIATGRSMQNEISGLNVNFGVDYENRNFTAPDRNKPKLVPPQFSAEMKHFETIKEEKSIYNSSMYTNNMIKKDQPGLAFPSHQQPMTNVPNQNVGELKIVKEEPSNNTVSRTDKLKALYKTGPRVFTGPVEKVLKWHKALQEIGLLVIYEIVAKCVSVRPGESCAKNLVVRDDSGPAMQVVYYEIDFLLPELKPPCTVRVIGRMMAGTCRLQAFNVRPATGDDVATLPRRAAVAAHHVAKLCKEYGIHI